MAVRIDGTNTAANPGITGADADTGLQFGTDEVSIVTGGTEKATVDSSGRLLVGTSVSYNAPSIEGTTQAASLNQIHSSAARVGSQLIAEWSSSTATGGSSLKLAKSNSGSVGSHTALGANHDIGSIAFAASDGTNFINAASILAEVDGTPGANDMPGRLVFSTTADGASSPTERMRIDSVGRLISIPTYNATSGSSANVGISSNGKFYRSTSSGKYKTNVETIQDSYADALLECRPVWYRSLCADDNPEHGYWGFIAEEVAEIDPRLVFWKTAEITQDENGSNVETVCDPEPEGVAYDRFVPHLLNLIKRQQQAIETLETQNASLETRLTALEGGAS